MFISGSSRACVPQSVPVAATARSVSRSLGFWALLFGVAGVSLLTGCGVSGGGSSVAAVPTLTPAAGTYTTAQTVTIGDTTPGAVLYCTTDGSAPTTSSPVCGEPTTVSKTQTLSAIAAEPGGSPSGVVSANYIINLPAAATPVISPVAGTYTAAQSVTITDATAGSTIYYTTDGTAPTASSTVYTGAIAIPATETVNAIAIASGYADSNVATAAFTINLPAPIPVITPAGGTFTGAQTVTLTDSLAGATFYYTLDGSTPTPGAATTLTSTTGTLAVNATNTTVTAAAIAPGYSISAPTSPATFVLDTASPTFSSQSGTTFTSIQNVTISDATAGSVIYYTATPSGGTPVQPMPGSGLSCNSPCAVQVAASETIEAVAVATNLSQSASTAIATYSVDLPQAATPVLSSPGGTFTAAQTVTITDATAAASIYYSTNGTAPSVANGAPAAGTMLYTGALSVASSETLQAIAVAYNYSVSQAVSATFNLVAATPVISSTGGTFSSAQTVTITDATTGSSIYYTTNGTTPSATNGTSYSGPITVSSTEVIEAIATETGFSTSAVASSSFTLLVAAPKISPASGTYTAVQSVAITDASTGAAIYYTTNGSTPSVTNGSVYTGPISVSSSETIQAIAVESGYTSSAVVTATYTINLPAAATPMISPAGGTFTSQTTPTVTLADATAGATIYYTLDSSTPSATNGAVYTAPFTVDKSEPVKAIAVATGYSNSVVASASFTINQASAAAPTFSPAAGTYTTVQTVSLADTTTGARIYYTIDGSTPSASSTLYAGTAITVSATETIKAIAEASDFNNSAVNSATFTINLAPAAAPTFSPATGTYSTAQTVSLSDATTGAKIYYTTNGSTPSASSTLYAGTAINVGATETIKAIATASGFTSSAVASAAYTITLAAAAAPTFTPAAGSYATAQTVSLGDATAGAHIYYTLDGSTPTTSSTLYTGTAISISASTTIKAIVTASGFTQSAVASAAYTITEAAAATPIFSLAAGTYNSAQTVSLSDTTVGSAIYYTTNGSTPSASSTLYNGTAITVSATETINAIAVAFGSSNSAVASATYTLMAGTPVISPSGGSFTTATQTVTITETASPGAAIYYTITAGATGAAPTAGSMLYSGAFTISATDTVEAIAVETGYTDSDAVSASFIKASCTTGDLCGTVSSGTSPIIGATVQMYTAGTGGYGSAPTSLGTSYVSTSGGFFDLAFTCPAAPADLVYVVAKGGNITGTGASNSGLGVMTALGHCASLATLGAVTVNEVTTVASVYSLSGFSAFDSNGGIDVGAPAPSVTCPASSIGNSTCNYPGLAAAFATVNNLVNIGSGAALTITPVYAANPVAFLNTSSVPQSRIDTLADILATCVEAASGCSTLLGDVGGAVPADTIQAALDIAQNPGTNVATLYALLQTTPPYTPTLAAPGSTTDSSGNTLTADTTAPEDWTLVITYTGAGLGVDPSDFEDNLTGDALAIDGLGNVWTSAGAEANNSGMIAGFSNLGAPLTPATTSSGGVVTYGGFGPSNFVFPIRRGGYSITVDASNNLWAVSANDGTPLDSIADVSATPGNPYYDLALVALPDAGGAYITTPFVTTPNGDINPLASSVAFDASGNLWVSGAPDPGSGGTNTPFLEFNSTTGAVIQTYASTNGADGLTGFTFDSNGGLWGGDAVNEDTKLYSGAGAALATYSNGQGQFLAAGFAGNIYTCDATGSGTYLVLNSSNQSGPLHTFSNSGGAGCGPLVVDGAGNIWSTESAVSGGHLTEVSAATGSLLTPTAGYTGTSGAESPTLLTVAASPVQAIDGSGNIWVLNLNNYSQGDVGVGNTLVEYIGVAAPTIAPLALATANGAQGTKP